MKRYNGGLMDFSQIVTYLLNDIYVFMFFKMILNILSVIMLSGLIKMILKKIACISNWRVVLQTLSNIVIGASIGAIIYKFGLSENILIGSCCGFFSAVIYRILLKKVYDKFGINANCIDEDK